MANILYQALGGEATAPAHQLVEVALHAEANSNCVKGAVAIALRAQCGHEHHITARRLNGKGLVLNWKVSARCWPTSNPPRNRQELDALPGLDGLLRPVDKEQAEADERERLAQAAREAAEFFQEQYEQRVAAVRL